MAYVTVKSSDIADNYRKLRALCAPAKVMPFIKAGGYGLGEENTVRVLGGCGADIFCAARIEDALRIKAAAPGAGVFLCSVYTDGGTVKKALDAGIVPSVDSVSGLLAAGPGAEVSLALDTGMGRFGLREYETDKFCEEYNKAGNIHIVSTFTHFANCFAGKKGERATAEQFGKFTRMLEKLRSSGVDCGMIHAANSAAALTCPQYRCDAVRVGSALYGRCRGAEEAGLARVGRLRARVIQVRTLRKGETVGYGSVFTAQRDMRVAVIDCGHADGAFVCREPDGFGPLSRLYYAKRGLTAGPLSCRLGEKQARIVGRVGLTSLAADVTDTLCAAGDEAEFDFNPVFCAPVETVFE